MGPCKKGARLVQSAHIPNHQRCTPNLIQTITNVNLVSQSITTLGYRRVADVDSRGEVSAPSITVTVLLFGFAT
jgi:hypothetical protein